MRKFLMIMGISIMCLTIGIEVFALDLEWKTKEPMLHGGPAGPEVQMR